MRVSRLCRDEESSSYAARRGNVPSASKADPPELFLSDHVFLARTGDHLILLDLRADAYLSIDPPYVAGLSERLGLSTLGDDDRGAGPAVDSLVSEMVTQGLLTKDCGSGKRAVLLDQGKSVREMPRYGVGGPKIRIRHVAAFLLAVLTANVRLRFGRIEATVRHVAERRKRWVSPDSVQARELVEIFRKLRPLAMGRRDLCLLNSLTLIEFLASFDVLPAWYFGVRMNEFLAHCWVQDGSTVYNDDVENVFDYAVIMKV